MPLYAQVLNKFLDKVTEIHSRESMYFNLALRFAYFHAKIHTLIFPRLS